MTANRNRIEALTAGEFVVVRLPVARKVGGLHEAILLDYIVRWAKQSRDGWMFRTEKQIEEDTLVSRHFQRKARESLAGLGLIEEDRRGIPAQLHFRVNYDTYHDLIGEEETNSGSSPTSPRNVSDQSDEFVGLERQDCRTIKGDTEETQEKEQNSLSRAKQLPREWEPNTEEVQYAKDRGFTYAETTEMAEDFRLYYHSHRRAMADWHLTWFRWVRTEAQKRKSRTTLRQPAPSRPVYANTEQY